ncbi:hypothetical protein, conserved [Babesia bigemina]|uniref:Uncharacterized protein n=1 Tax=Babesia bigemina TaxID=5866 RepID=A0A061CZN1_BABBI|nr:hypothetical protein, conserved [Babesia bigemina]CDR94081.1 hypothetical protein, conserved [Babesia bigemina]|eukprot:XP_012766267.1 hypothetical protein, conserved [Babesia bigemina]
MAAGNRLSGLTAFSRAVHLGLARVNAQAALTSVGAAHSTAKAAYGYLSQSRTTPVYKAAANNANKGKAGHEIPLGEAASEKSTRTVPPPASQRDGRVNAYTKNDATHKKGGDSGPRRDERRQDPKRVSLQQDSRFLNPQNDEPENYYDIKDPRNAVPSPGFDENDRRAKITSREDATDEIELEFDGEPLPHRNASDRLGTFGSRTVTLKKPCVVTKRLITVEAPIHSLTGRDVLEAVLHGLHHYAPFTTVEQLYKHVQTDSVTVGTGKGCESELLASLEDHVCLLARNRGLRVREAVMLAMIYDHQGSLRPEIRDALAVALQMQLWAFRPYDVAATVSVYGKYGSRYRPLLNTLGLVFYDMMIAGKTAVAPQGPSVDEMLAVIESYSRVDMPIKRVTDAAFGTLYQHVSQMSRGQMLTVLDAFFKLSQDGNFVELYTKIIGKLFGQPVLFVDGFQKYAERYLNANFQSPMENTDIATIGEQSPAYAPNEVMRLMVAMAKCKSEQLIHAVHNRIEFKRLWSQNIRDKIMPWKASVVEPGAIIAPGLVAPPIDHVTMVEAAGRDKVSSGVDVCRAQISGNDHATANKSVDVTGDNAANHGADVQQVTREADNQVNTSPEPDAEIPLDVSSGSVMVSYADQIPLIYEGMLRMLSDTLGFTQHPKHFSQLIYDANRSVVSKTADVCKELGVDSTFERLSRHCRAHYPFVASLYAIWRRYGTPGDSALQHTADMPLFKVDGASVQACPNTPEDVIIIHANQLIKSATDGSEENKQSGNAGLAANTVYPYLCSYERRLNEAMHALSVGGGANVDKFCTGPQVSANDLALTIRALQDYARYADHLHTETVNHLAALYFRMLFVSPSAPVASAEVTSTGSSEFLNCIMDATPTSLMVEHGHIPFTQNKNAVGNPEFYQVRHAEYMYYKPTPLFTDLFRGNAELYGLMMYTVAHKLQYSGTRGGPECDLASTVQVVCTMQHVLHPFYVIARGSTNDILKWHALYYKGVLNACHRVKGSQLKGNCIDVKMDSLEHSLGDLGDDANTEKTPKSQLSHQLPHADDNGTPGACNGAKEYFAASKTGMKELELLRDTAFAEAAADISKVMRCPLFRHSATVFALALLEYIRQAIEALQYDVDQIGLSGCAEISRTLSMLIAFQQMMEMELDVAHQTLLNKCQNDIVAVVASKVMAAAEDEPGVGRDLMALPRDTAWRGESQGGFAERVESLSIRMERQDFLRTAHAMAISLSAVELTEPLADAVHTIMQVMYKRLPYMADIDLVGAAITVTEVYAALVHTQDYSEEDPGGRLTQLVRILRVQCRELIEMQPAHTDEVYTLSTCGRLALIAAIA